MGESIKPPGGAHRVDRREGPHATTSLEGGGEARRVRVELAAHAVVATSAVGEQLLRRPVHAREKQRALLDGGLWSGVCCMRHQLRKLKLYERLVEANKDLGGLATQGRVRRGRRHTRHAIVHLFSEREQLGPCSATLLR